MGHGTSINPNNRPQMPSLSASASRGLNRPLTPKVASSKEPQRATVAPTSTPLNRRPPRPTTASSNRESASNRSSQHDESLAPFLANNITPRSGSRQNRVDSASSTPNGTPNPERAEGWDPRSSFGFPSPSLEPNAAKRPVVTFGSAHPTTNGHGKQEAQNDPDSKFFHASDAKNARPLSAAKPIASKGPTFFYANGNTVENKPANASASSLGISQPQDSLSSKFMYANGTPDLRPSPPPLVSRGSGSTVSTASKAPISRPGTNPPLGNHPPTQRPGSPIKFQPQPQLASLKSHNAPPSAAARSHISSPPQLGPSPPGLRRSSNGSRVGGHSRSGSSVMGDHGLNATRFIATDHMSPEPSPPLPSSRPAPLTLASIIQAAEDFAENDEDSLSPDDARSSLHSPTNLQSPTKSTHSADPFNELVANARRERKVQDLQITNASLEAINRTLERQLKKQSAELRRYRRLSRSGRLSLASTTVSSRVPSGSVPEDQALGLGLSDLSEEESEPEDELEDESFSDTDSASESLSPSLMAERDARHRKKDEKRLQLDLSKHQQLLVDSQKINQSIKRCMDWTEELIKEGKKALEYQVRVSDVKLGGRVLDPLDEEDDRLQNMDTPDDTIALDNKTTEEAGDSANWSVAPQDRDSGIELTVDGG
ncbi:hypothetical protein F4778DRAFT_781170 [Xylariomycetidae sp. FL2044]|nr:hypothetical protein F4778DRAFT_781170 [Xylariomycetidae sp. FL2044]